METNSAPSTLLQFFFCPWASACRAYIIMFSFCVYRWRCRLVFLFLTLSARSCLTVFCFCCMTEWLGLLVSVPVLVWEDDTWAMTPSLTLTWKELSCMAELGFVELILVGITSYREAMTTLGRSYLALLEWSDRSAHYCSCFPACPSS